MGRLPILQRSIVDVRDWGERNPQGQKRAPLHGDEQCVLMPRGVFASRWFEVGLIPQQPDLVALQKIRCELCRLLFQKPLLQRGVLFPEIFAEIPVLAELQHAGFQTAAGGAGLGVCVR